MRAKISILLVEDNEDDYLLTEELLDQTKVTLAWAQTLNEALLRISNEQFEVILLDLGVPDSQGIETFDRLQRELSKMPVVIVLTGNDDDEVAKEALQRGAQDYLVKGQVNSELLMRSLRYSIERRNADRQLRESNEQLLLLNDELKSARDRALEASRLKSQFVANISHELRTPLAGVLGLIDLVAEELQAGEEKSLLATARESGQHLLTIVNDLLDFSKIEAGYMQISESQFNLKKTIELVVETMSSVARKKNIFLLAEVEPEIPAVMGDEVKLKQILLNLVSNAIKFTNQGGTRIQASLGDTANEMVCVQFAVSDTGIGISPSERRHLFEPFTQVDNSNTRPYGGTGLGLAITKRLVELMGGTIGLSSIKGKGSTFWFSIPFHIAQAQAPQEVQVPQETLCFCPILTGDVLVVEDNNVLQMLTKRQLENIGFQADLVSDGRSAISAVSQRRYCMILMDLQLPQLDGYQATREIRRLEAQTGLRTPIVAITASARAEDIQRCIDVGMDDVLTKPVSSEALSSVMSKWIELPYVAKNSQAKSQSIRSSSRLDVNKPRQV